MRRHYRLDALCDIRSGGTPPRSSSANYGGNFPWAKIDDLNVESGVVSSTKEYITEIGLQSIRGRLFEPGTLLFAMYGSVGKMAWAGVRLATNQAILGISVLEPQKLAPSYLKHWLASKQADFDRDANGVTQKNLSAGYVRDLEIELPPIEEQQRIATILDKADSLRRKRQEAIRLGNEFLRAVFHQRFATKPRSSVLPDYCDFLAGFAFKSDQYIDPSDGVRLLRGINVGIDRFEWGESAGYPKSNVSDLERYRLEEGDVVLAMDRPWISTGLKCAVVDAQVAGSYLVQRVARLRPKQQGMSAFIMNCLLGDDFKSHCRITETTIPHISPKDFATFAVPTVSEDELSHFADLAAKVQRIASKAVLASASTEELIASLQEAFFNTH